MKTRPLLVLLSEAMLLLAAAMFVSADRCACWAAAAAADAGGAPDGAAATQKPGAAALPGSGPKPGKAPAKAGVDAARPATLENELLRAEFGDHGLIALTDKHQQRTLRLAQDHWSFIIEHHLVDSDVLQPKQRTTEPGRVRYRFHEGIFDIEVVYELKPGWRFVTKQLFVTNRKESAYTVRHVDVWHGQMATPVRQVQVVGLGEKTRRARQLGDYAAFLQIDDRWGVMLLTQNPFFRWTFHDGRFSMDYRADLTWESQWGPFASDRACLGPYEPTGQVLPAQIDPHGRWLMKPQWQDGLQIDAGQVQAVIDCVRSFLLYRPTRSVRIHVPWCENDYQINVATDDGVAQFKRIVDSAAALGVQHMLYTVRNDAIALQEEASDAWHWEHLLWLNMGIAIRQNRWDPCRGALPARTRELIGYAASKHIKLMAYVYPTVAFEQNPAWLTRRHPHQERLAANTGFRALQDWLINALDGFQRNTGISGYAFDYWGLHFPGSSPYAQWFGARRVLEQLRQRRADIVIDGRQSYQGYGPWTWLAGNYPHPAGGDEQPESFEPFPDLHYDRSCGTHQRRTAYWYRNVQFCPTELMPGFIGHQTARKDARGRVIYDRDFNIRDWDWLGWKFSLFSSIATAPFHHCFSMIPARDVSEFRAFQRDKENQQFLRRWLDWTDRHAATLRHLRSIIGPPAIGRADGTAAIDGDHGFIFLFNPNHRKVVAQFRLDETIGLACGKRFLLRQLYPEKGKCLASPDGGLFRFGQTCRLLMDGTSVWVLEVVPEAKLQVGRKDPLLLNVRGNGQLEGDTLVLTEVRGEVGTTVTAHVLLPSGTAISKLLVNGQPFDFEQNGSRIAFRCGFSGRYFCHNQPLTEYDPSFAGRTVKAKLNVPARVFEQLEQRRAKWPIEWTEQELQCTWLAPERLLLYVQVAEGDWTMDASLKLDGHPYQLKKAYASRTPGMLQQGKGHNTFLGFYADLSHLEPDRTYQLQLTLPPGLKPGQFQGMFVENVETQYTDRVEPAR